MLPYPLQFAPRFVPKVWGGRRLATVLGKDLPGGDSDLIGESWEVCDLPEHSSIITNGPWAGQSIRQVIDREGLSLMGRLPLLEDGSFPLLIKYLDTRAPLSVQVHPASEYASNHPEVGIPKNEAWYILEAEPGSYIYRGLQPGVTPESLRTALERGDMDAVLQRIPAKAGRCYYSPAGVVHAIGPGILLAEIQTPSDVTFRMHDWGRTDRELHLDAAIEAVQYDPLDVRQEEKRSHVAGVFSTVSLICNTPHFRIEKVRAFEGFGQELPYNHAAVWMIVDGHGTISNTPARVDVDFKRGDVLFLPAGLDEARVDLHSDSAWLEIQVPASIENIRLA